MVWTAPLWTYRATASCKVNRKSCPNSTDFAREGKYISARECKSFATEGKDISARECKSFATEGKYISARECKSFATEGKYISARECKTFENDLFLPHQFLFHSPQIFPTTMSLKGLRTILLPFPHENVSARYTIASWYDALILVFYTSFSSVRHIMLANFKLIWSIHCYSIINVQNLCQYMLIWELLHFLYSTSSLSLSRKCLHQAFSHQSSRLCRLHSNPDFVALAHYS